MTRSHLHPLRRRIRTLALLAAAFLLAGVAQAQVTLELVPKPFTEHPEEGPPSECFLFPNPPGHVLYTPPPGWIPEADRDSLTLRHPDTLTTTLTLSVVPTRGAPALPAGGPADRAAIEAYAAVALAALPERATGAEVVSKTPSLIEIERAHALEIQVRYLLHGQLFRKACVFLPQPNQQIRFALTTPEDRFPRDHQAMRASLFTWQFVHPDPTRSPAR